jgi:hypothetical protein
MCHFLQGLLLDQGHKDILHWQVDKNEHKNKKLAIKVQRRLLKAFDYC